MSVHKFSNLLAILTLFIATAFNSCVDKNNQEQTVKEVMDQTVTKLYKTMSEKQLDSLTDNQVMALFTDKEKKVLATKHWMFDVNVPVVVSVMRSTEQKTVPFWLAPAGFVKTNKIMKNEQA
ncbi:MAG TPA: hypothetical protein VFF57_12780, partial [Hanamia sp.]|nr:hypothetical protein [Hanamia sp.]